MRNRVPGKGELHTSHGVGHKEGHALDAILEDDVSESASLVDARVPLEHVGQAHCRRDIIRRQVLENTIRGTVTIRSFLELDRPLGEAKVQGAVKMIAHGRPSESASFRDPFTALISEAKGNGQEHSCRQRPPPAESDPATQEQASSLVMKTRPQLPDEFGSRVKVGCVLDSASDTLAQGPPPPEIGAALSTRLPMAPHLVVRFF